MLLNLAPLPDGSIRPEEEAVLKGLVPWMKKYAEAIHGTRGGPWHNGPWGGSTHRGKTVYVHVFAPKDEPINLRALPQKVVAAATLDGTALDFKQTTHAVSFEIPQAARDPHVTVIKLTLGQPVAGPLDGPAMADQVENDPAGTLVFSPTAAHLEGGLLTQERGGVSSIGYWGNPNGSAAWDIGISSPGTYQLQLSVSNNQSGASLLVEIGGKSFTVDVPNTGDHDTYKAVDAGKITFSNAEKSVLRVSVANKGNWRPTNIRNVKMVPSNR